MEVTLDGLNHWYKHHLQKFGRVVIAHESGNTSKLQRFIESSKRLLNKINEKAETVESPDTMRDLQIMAQHVTVLLNHAQQMTGGAEATGAYMGEQKYLEEKRRRDEERRRREEARRRMAAAKR